MSLRDHTHLEDCKICFSSVSADTYKSRISTACRFSQQPTRLCDGVKKPLFALCVRVCVCVCVCVCHELLTRGLWLCCALSPTASSMVLSISVYTHTHTRTHIFAQPAAGSVPVNMPYIPVMHGSVRTCVCVLECICVCVCVPYLGH